MPSVRQQQADRPRKPASSGIASGISLRRRRNCPKKAATRKDASPTSARILSRLVPVCSPAPHLRPAHDLTSIKTLPNVLTPDLTGLQQPDLALLTDKQQQLRQSRFCEAKGGARLAEATRATLVFAQREAGTAVCVSRHGLLLTCSHCVAEDPEEMSTMRGKWLLFASGQAVYAECVAWDPRRDLALLQIIEAQPQPQALPNRGNTVTASHPSVPFVPIAEVPPRLRTGLTCIGHPGNEDLEASKPGRKTGYDVLHISTGLFRGDNPGQDPQDNSEIGALRHDSWTYWGHSGAPLVEQATGRLIGLHSSWDETTGMRRGVPLDAIKQFLDEYTGLHPSSQSS